MEKLAKWLIFSVALALVPVLVTFLGQITRGAALTWHEGLGRGELLLIAAGLCASSSGELFTAPSSSRLGKILAGGAALLLLLISAGYFAEVAATLRSQTKVETVVVAQFSLML